MPRRSPGDVRLTAACELARAAMLVALRWVAAFDVVCRVFIVHRAVNRPADGPHAGCAVSD